VVFSLASALSKEKNTLFVNEAPHSDPAKYRAPKCSSHSCRSCETASWPSRLASAAWQAWPWPARRRRECKTTDRKTKVPAPSSYANAESCFMYTHALKLLSWFKSYACYIRLFGWNGPIISNPTIPEFKQRPGNNNKRQHNLPNA
jgi:hypothetical protein